MSQVSPNPIPGIGTPPSTSDTANFDDRGDAVFAALPATIDGMNAAATVTFGNAVDAYNNALSAAASMSAASASAANVAALSNFKGDWASQAGAMNKPASVFHNGAFWSLLNNLANVAASQPGVTADWQVCGGAWPIIPINTNTTAVPWRTYLIYGACTLTMPAITGNGKQVGIIVLPGVTGAIFAPAGADKTRGVTGNQPFDSVPFNATVTDQGATYGWV